MNKANLTIKERTGQLIDKSGRRTSKLHTLIHFRLLLALVTRTTNRRQLCDESDWSLRILPRRSGLRFRQHVRPHDDRTMICWSRVARANYTAKLLKR